MITVNVTAGVPDSFPAGRLGVLMSGNTANFIMPEDLANPNAAVSTALGLTSITATPVTVSKNFAGINTGESDDGVAGTYNPVTDVRFGLYRSHDTAGMFWKDMETSAGVYNFTNLGAWLDTYHGKGKLIYMVYNTPAFYSARPGTGGPYSPTQGWQAEPADMTKLTDYLTALCNYVNGRGQFIDYFEVWNEPNFTNSSSGFRFYDGTVAKLSELVRITNQAVKAVFPTTKIICPAVTNLDNSPAMATADVAQTYFASMMAASDGSAGTMANWVDVVGYHSYGSGTSILTRVNIIKAAAVAAGLGALPIIDTEVGQNLLPAAASDTEYYLRICRNMVVQAAAGIAGTCIYAIGSLDPLTGYSIQNRPIFKNALNNLIRRLVRYGIDSASIASDGTVYATINGEMEKF
jgi:hypothetical protein